MNTPSIVSIRHIPAANRIGSTPGEDEQADLGGGVEAEADAVHEAALVQLILELLFVEVALTHPAEHPDDADQHHQVEDAEDSQEHPETEAPITPVKTG